MRCGSEKEQAFKQSYVNKRFKSITAIYGIIIDELARVCYDGRFNYGSLNSSSVDESATAFSDEFTQETTELSKQELESFNSAEIAENSVSQGTAAEDTEAESDEQN